MSTATPYDVAAIRADFPILAREVYGKPLVYLDNGASAQKPKVVLDTIMQAYGHEYANVHRGLHYLSNTATQHFEDARETAAEKLKSTGADASAALRAFDEMLRSAKEKEKAANAALKQIEAQRKRVMSIGVNAGGGMTVDVKGDDGSVKPGVALSAGEDGLNKRITIPLPSGS